MPTARALADGKAELALVLSLAHRQFEQGSDPASIIASNFSRSSTTCVASSIPMSGRRFFRSRRTIRYRNSFIRTRSRDGPSRSPGAIRATRICSTSSTATRASTRRSQQPRPLGKALYGYTRHAPASVAVRERRDLLTQHVDEIAAARGPETEILTIAAGHLREANRSIALREGRIKRWVALDQDPLSVGSIDTRLQGNARRRDRRLGSRPADQRLQARPVRLRLLRRVSTTTSPAMSR